MFVVNFALLLRIIPSTGLWQAWESCPIQNDPELGNGFQYETILESRPLRVDANAHAGTRKLEYPPIYAFAPETLEARAIPWPLNYEDA